MRLTYSFDNPIISKIEIDGNIYDKVSIPDCYTAGNTGEPDIPSKGAYILLPPELKVNNIQVKAKNKEILGTNYNINPISQPIPISNVKVSVKLQKDNNIYDNNALYPGNLYTFVGTYSFKGYEILVLLLHPMQYNSVTGELFYYKDLEITIETKYNDKSGLFRGLKRDELEVKNKVDNPEISELYSKELGTKPASFDSYDLLILTADSLKSSFGSLKNAHDANGLNTIIKTLTDIGSSDPLDIRDYIRDAYSNWGVDYVLIGGDIEVIPARTLYVYGLDEETTPYETFMPSDLYYSCLNGPYNYDGDENWGEPTDGEDGGDVDLMAEVHVGRACVDDVSDVNNFVSKTVDYINKKPKRNYLNKACFAGEYMGEHGIATWGGNYLDQLIDVCNDDGYTTTGIPSDEFDIIKIYDKDWPGNNWPKEKIIDEIDSSLHIINHLGHSYFEYNLKMHYEDVYSLSNGDYCFIYSQGCMAGGFDCDYCDCIAEHFTVKTDTGAFAGIWNARYGFFWANSTDGDSQRFHREYWDAVFGEMIPGVICQQESRKCYRNVKQKIRTVRFAHWWPLRSVPPRD